MVVRDERSSVNREDGSTDSGVVRMNQVILVMILVSQSVRSCCCRWYFLIRNRLTAYTISRMDRCTFSPHAATSTLNTRLWPLITLHLITNCVRSNRTFSLQLIGQCNAVAIQWSLVLSREGDKNK